MTLKCACGCGQDIPAGTQVVGVPLGNGNHVAFIPMHHQGGIMNPNALNFQNNPRSVQDIKKSINEYIISAYDMIERANKMKNDAWRKYQTFQYAKNSMESAWALFGRALKINEQDRPTLFRLNDLQVKIGKLSESLKLYPRFSGKPYPKRNPNGKAMVIKETIGAVPDVIRTGHETYREGKGFGKEVYKDIKKAEKEYKKAKSRKNPRRPPQEFWGKTYPQVREYYMMRYPKRQAEQKARAVTASIWHDKISPRKKKAYEAARKMREGRGRFRINADDGTINVNGSKIIEVRYLEKGTGIPYAHKLVRPVKMRVRKGRVKIPTMTVRPEGITQ